MEYIAPFWYWFILGGILLAVEVLIVPIGFFLCIGTASCILGVISFFFREIPLVWAVILFALLSLIACYTWWSVLRKRSGGIDHADTTGAAVNVREQQLLGMRAVLLEPLKNGRGRLKINDSSWPVEANTDYPAGIRVEVIEITGITLKIKQAD